MLRTTHDTFSSFPLFGMDKLKNSGMARAYSWLRFRTHIVESSNTIKVPFPDALKKFIEFLSLPHLSPSYNRPGNSTGMHMSQSRDLYELLIVDE